MTQQIAVIWALICVAGTVTLIVRARHIGREKASAWLVVLGLIVLAQEEPLLAWFWGLSTPGSDPDGMATLITPAARAHVLDSAIFGAAFLAMIGWIALTAFRRGEQWAMRAVAAGWVLAAVTITATTLAVYSRGLPLTSVGELPPRPAYGWEQLTAGLLAWASGLWLMWSTMRARVSALSVPSVPSGQ